MALVQHPAVRLLLAEDVPVDERAVHVRPRPARLRRARHELPPLGVAFLRNEARVHALARRGPDAVRADEHVCARLGAVGEVQHDLVAVLVVRDEPLREVDRQEGRRRRRELALEQVEEL